jgi:hypothetical protein
MYKHVHYTLTFKLIPSFIQFKNISLEVCMYIVFLLHITMSKPYLLIMLEGWKGWIKFLQIILYWLSQSHLVGQLTPHFSHRFTQVLLIGNN